MGNEISIVICTYNRSGRIGKLISAFDHEVLLPDDLNLEVLFVDNNSTDSTKKIISEAISKKRGYIVSYAFEEKSGLSNARNRGIKEAKFERISFLDDDVLPGSGFLTALNTAFVKNPGVSCFAHKVINHLINRPSWYRLEGKYRMLNRGSYDLGNTSRFLTENDPLPIGSGMVVSRRIFTQLGMFDLKFGYNATKSMMLPGEETEFFVKVRQHGISIFYIHDAVAHHFPDNKKYNLETLCKTYTGIGYWYGSVDARKFEHEKIITWAGFPRAYYKRFFLDLIPCLITRFLFGKTVKYYYFFQLKKIIGQFKGFKAFR